MKVQASTDNATGSMMDSADIGRTPLESDEPGSSAVDPRIMQAAREYLIMLESGGKTTRSELLARYPDLIGPLNECFDGIDLAHAMKSPSNACALDPAIQPATPLGDFQIIREIARGGMGVVYEAIQLSLGRRVALKVLPFASALDGRQLQRFKIEAQAAAQLHHSNIVPVYAVGCDRGVHYYAMQLIDGQSLADLLRQWSTDWADHRQLGTGHERVRSDRSQGQSIQTKAIAHSSTIATGKSRWRQIAQWVAEVAEALEFAHASGVVHRDIKPANLMINCHGRIWITDFGLAHVAADVSLTRSGELLGTLRYMSPELAMGQRTPVDQRTDIYSLGATLYELLTRTPIFPAEERAALLYQILHEEPKPPRQIDRAIPIELETIVLKALAKSASDRYATALEFSNDLRRFLQEQPILARRPSIVDKTRKWLRRHPAFVAAGALLLLFGSLGSAVAATQVWNQQKLTQQALEREQDRAQQAEYRFEMARRVADELIQLAEDEALDEPFQEGLRTRLLETALNYYQEFIQQREDHPSDQAVLQATSQRVQQILADLAVLKADRSLFLLRNPDVLDDLRATHSQRLQLMEALSDLHFQPGPVPGPVRLPPGPGSEPGTRRPSRLPHRSREELIATAREHEEKLSGILSDEQYQRLGQIALQFHGMGALREFEVIKRLGLSNQQQEQIKRIHYENTSLPGDRPLGPRTAMPRAMTSEMTKALFEVLTPQQRQTWSDMVGRPFKGGL